MSLTSIYPMKKKRKLAKDKTPVRKTSRNRDANCSMAAPMLGTPSPNNSSIDVDKDIIWDNCSPTQHIPMRLRNKGLSDASDIAQFMKLVPAEKAVNVELPPLLGLWMERGHELITENLVSSSRQPRAKGRKTRSKVGHLKSDVFSSELCKLAKLIESKQESPVATDKLKLRSSKSYESPMRSRTSTPYHEKFINTKGKRKSLNASNELWGQDEWFEDEVFLRQATQIEHDVCSQIYNEEKSNKNDTKIINEPIPTVRQSQQQPKTHSFLPSYKTPVARKMKREKNDKPKPAAAKNMFTGDINANKTEKKQVCVVPTVPLKPRQLHGTFQNSVRIESENIDVNPNNDAPASVDAEEVWDDLDDDELVGLESVLDTVSFTPKTLKNPDCQRPSSRNCFRMTKPSAQVDTKITDGGLNKQLAFQAICSPVTRSMTRDQNHRFRGQDSESTNDTAATNNNQHYSQEQIEKKRQLAIQRRKERTQQVLKTTRNTTSSKQINRR